MSSSWSGCSTIATWMTTHLVFTRTHVGARGGCAPSRSGAGRRRRRAVGERLRGRWRHSSRLRQRPAAARSPQVAASRRLPTFAFVMSRDGRPELVIRGEHPLIAMPVLPRRRHEIGQPVQEVKPREFDDAVNAWPRGLAFAPRADPVGRLVSGEHVADEGDAAVFTADHGEPFEREGRPGTVSQKMLTPAPGSRAAPSSNSGSTKPQSRKRCGPELRLASRQDAAVPIRLHGPGWPCSREFSQR